MPHACLMNLHTFHSVVYETYDHHPEHAHAFVDGLTEDEAKALLRVLVADLANEWTARDAKQ